MTTFQKPSPTLTTDALTELDASWWDRFIQTTKQVSETAVLSDALSPHTVASLLREVLQVIRMMCLRQSDGGGFLRAYLNDQKLNPAQLAEYVYPNPPQVGESVRDWADRAYGKTPFCLIFNYGELLSDRLCQQLTGLIMPFLEQWGIPLNGLHTTTFVGNYGYTPLGIHQDNVGGNVIHFHLGPGPKTMYTWDEQLYAQLAQGKPNNKDIEPLLPHATTYTFGAGDIYYMPWNKFHIGYSDMLSVGVTLWFDNHTNDVVFMKLLQDLRERLFDVSQSRITAPEHLSKTPGQSFDEIIRLVRPTALTDFDRPFEMVLHDEYAHHSRRLVSNGGWKVSPTPRNPVWQVQDINHVSQLVASQVQLIEPFRLLYVPADTHTMKVYCRGNVITAPMALLSLVDDLNTGDIWTTQALLEPFDTGLRSAAITLLMALYNTRGLATIPLL